jgi:serine/threonine protein kinase
MLILFKRLLITMDNRTKKEIERDTLKQKLEDAAGVKISRSRNDASQPRSYISDKKNNILFHLKAGGDKHNSTRRGAGFFGQVKDAVNQQQGTVAVKVIKITGDPFANTSSREYAAVKTAFKELDILNKLGRHATLTYNAEKTNDTSKIYITQPIIPGERFDTVIEKMVEKSDKAENDRNTLLQVYDNYLSMMTNAIQSMAELHDNGIIHKDITGGNIHIDQQSSKAWVLDFGNSELVEEYKGDQEEINEEIIEDYSALNENVFENELMDSEKWEQWGLPQSLVAELEAIKTIFSTSIEERKADPALQAETNISKVWLDAIDSLKQTLVEKMEVDNSVSLSV